MNTRILTKHRWVEFKAIDVDLRNCKSLDFLPGNHFAARDQYIILTHVSLTQVLFVAIAQRKRNTPQVLTFGLPNPDGAVVALNQNVLVIQHINLSGLRVGLNWQSSIQRCAELIVDALIVVVSALVKDQAMGVTNWIGVGTGKVLIKNSDGEVVGIGWTQRLHHPILKRTKGGNREVIVLKDNVHVRFFKGGARAFIAANKDALKMQLVALGRQLALG